jgi:hypothetical protein
VNAYGILVGKPEGQRLPGRHTHRWECNIRVDLRVLEWGGMDWNDLAQDGDQWRALENTVINLRVRYSFGKILENLSDWWALKKGTASKS